MFARRVIVLRVVVVLVAVVFRQSTAAAAMSVEVADVPSGLAFPLPGGANVVLTATVRGGEARAAWLAASSGAPARFMLAPLGGGHYQVNLADPVLAAILRAQPEKQFCVFAEAADGRLAASVPIHYTVAEALRAPPTIYVYADGERQTIMPTAQRGAEDPALRAHIAESDLWVFADAVAPGQFGRRIRGGHYFAPARVEKILIHFDSDTPPSIPEARVAEYTWTFRPSGPANVMAFDLTAEIRAAWKQHGELELLCDPDGKPDFRASLRVMPGHLDLPGGSAQITIVQRRAKIVPGSNDYVAVYIDDITAGQVLLSILTADGQKLVDQASVRQGDQVAFTVGDAGYKLVVDKLVNLLIGDDFGQFTISSAAPTASDEKAEREKIERLIEIVRTAAVTFIREGKAYTPAEAADHIRGKYEYARDEIRTADDFIDKVASRSWLTGRDYLIRLPDGREVKAGAWLRQQLAKSAAEPAKPSEEQAKPK